MHKNIAQISLDGIPTEVFLNHIQNHVKYALQPIVDINTGTVFGYETLLRDYNKLNLPSIHALFDQAWELGILHQTDLLLREKALSTFADLPFRQNEVLFFNLDGRCFESPDYAPEQTDTILKQLELPLGSLCLELSERHNCDDALDIRVIAEGIENQQDLLLCRDIGCDLAQGYYVAKPTTLIEELSGYYPLY